MYEVDSVFYDKGKISEERTQVIRIIFRVELDRIPSELPSISKLKMVKDFLRFTGKMEDFLEERQQDEDLSFNNEAEKVFNYLRKWVGEATLFTFGYVLYRICYVIEMLNKEKGRDEEAEIWVTSVWSLVLDRVVKVRI